MKVLWLQDLDPLVVGGGAQTNDKRMIMFGIKERGVEIEIVTPQNVSQGIKADLVVFSNCVTFPRQTLEYYANNYPLVIFSHDYFFCKYRLFFPGNESCKVCPGVKFWSGLHKKAMLNVFLSPLHRKMHEGVFGADVLGRECCIPSAVDVNYWSSPDLPRIKNTVVGVNALLPFKGRKIVEDYVRQHQELKFIFAGAGDSISAKNAQSVGGLNHEQLRLLYQTSEFAIQLSDNAQPFEQTAAEAYLSGCKMIYNDNIGFFSYPWNYADRNTVRDLLRQAAPAFWDEIYSLFPKVNG